MPLLRFLSALAALALLAAHVPPAAAQTPQPVLVLNVVDAATGAPVPGARVGFGGRPPVGLTDDAGRLEVNGLRAAQYSVAVERVGYQRLEFVADMRRGGRLDAELELHPEAVALEAVAGRAVRQRNTLRDLGFYERARTGFATTMERGAIEARRPMQTVDLFRGMRGFRVVPSPRGGAPMLVSGRGQVNLSLNPYCAPVILVDGARTASPDLDAVRPEDIEAIEAYPGVAGVPLRYNPEPSPCGTVLIWTKRGN